MIGILRLRLRGNLVPVPPVIAARRLDLDDLGAEVGQDHRGARGGNEARQIHDFQARKDVVASHDYPLLLQVSSSPLESRGALFQEGGRSFLLVLGCGAEPEVGGLEQQAIALARLQALVDRLQRQLDGDGRL